MQLWQKITLGLILGIAFGIYLPQQIIYIKPLGEVFLRLIRMIIMPLIFFSLVSGITSMNDPTAFGRVGIKAFVAFAATTFFAVIFGILIATILKPGEGINIDLGKEAANFRKSHFNLLSFCIEFIPNNIIGAFAEGNILQVVFFAIFTGFVVNNMGSKADKLKNIFRVLSKMTLKMVDMIMYLSPYGAFALTALMVSEQGFDILHTLSKLVCAILIALICQYILFGLMIIGFCRISPIPFYKKSLEYQILAFSTASSKIALATAMKVSREKLGISVTSTSFILPLGVSINMVGFAINLALTTVFFAQGLSVTLGGQDYFIIILTSALCSIGGAGIPGASLIMLPAILSSIGLPIEVVAILTGIDRIIDMMRTTVNITGDIAITLIIDHSEGLMDREVYYSKVKV